MWRLKYSKSTIVMFQLHLHSSFVEVLEGADIVRLSTHQIQYAETYFESLL